MTPKIILNPDGKINFVQYVVSNEKFEWSPTPVIKIQGYSKTLDLTPKCVLISTAYVVARDYNVLAINEKSFDESSSSGILVETPYQIVRFPGIPQPLDNPSREELDEERATYHDIGVKYYDDISKAIETMIMDFLVGLIMETEGDEDGINEYGNLVFQLMEKSGDTIRDFIDGWMSSIPDRNWAKIVNFTDITSHNEGGIDK